MSIRKKAAHEAEAAVGSAKEKIGHVVGNKDLEAQGRRDQTKVHLKEAGDDLKDAVNP